MARPAQAMALPRWRQEVPLPGLGLSAGARGLLAAFIQFTWCQAHYCCQLGMGYGGPYCDPNRADL